MRGTELTTTTKHRHRYFLRRRLFRSLFVWSSFVFVYRGGGGGGGGGGIIAKQSHKRHYYREISSSSSNFFVSKIKKMSRLFILFGLLLRSI